VTKVVQCTVNAAIGLAASVMQIPFQIKWFYPVETQKLHTTISTPVWLHVSVFSKQSSGQYLPVEGTIGVQYALWDPILFTGCA
jgi:hypothetical protein